MVCAVRKSASADAAKRAHQATIMALSPIDRMKRALEAGETARIFANLGVQSRARKR